MADSRSDEENQRILRDTREAFEGLRTEQIRNEEELRRLEREEAALREEAKRLYGTDDEEELRRMAEETRRRNTERVDEHAGTLREIREALREIAAGR